MPDRWRPVDFRELERLLESRGRHSIPDEPARVPIAVPPPEPAIFAEHSVAAFTAARAEDLNLIEFRALNHGRDLPRMRRWEIPFAIFQARLSGGMEVLDCTLNPEGFERALAELYPDVRYRHFEPVSGGKLALPEKWQDERFDRVFCINTLEHVPREERERLIAFIARILKPGGRLITTLDYYFESSFSRQDWIDRGLVRSDRQEVFGGFNRIPPAELAEMCQRAGLSPLAPIPADPEEGDPSLYLQAAPLEHTTVGAVFSKGVAATPRPPRVLLAMLSWNTLAISRDSIGALIREARMLGRVGVEAGICLVDNGSDDGTAQAIEELDAAIDVTHRFFLNPQNLGNSRARNQIIGYALSAGFDYVLFTDGDIEIVPFSTMAMLRYLECSPAEVGCIGAFSAGCSPRRAQSTPVLFSLSGFEIASSDVLAWTQYGMFRRSLFESGIRFDRMGRSAARAMVLKTSTWYSRCAPADLPATPSPALPTCIVIFPPPCRISARKVSIRKSYTRTVGSICCRSGSTFGRWTGRSAGYERCNRDTRIPMGVAAHRNGTLARRRPLSGRTNIRRHAMTS